MRGFNLKMMIGILLGSQLAFGAIQHGNQTIKGTLNVTGATTLGTASSTQFSADNLRLDGNTISTTNTNGDLTIDLNGTGSTIFADLTATTVPYLDSSKKLASSAATPTQLGYLANATSNICGINQTCTFTNKSFSGSVGLGVSASRVLVSDTFGNLATSVTSSAEVAYLNGLAATAGQVLYTDGSKITGVGIGTTGYVLTSNGSGAPAWSAPVAGSPPGAYRYIGTYPQSTSNYWSNTSGSYGEFTVVGTIPTISIQHNSGFTVTNAGSDRPGCAFTAPRTGTIRVTFIASVLPGQIAGSNSWALQLYEGTTATALAYISGGVTAQATTNAEWPVTLIGYLPVTISTSYDIRLRSATAGGSTFYVGASTVGNALNINLEYVE